MSPKVENYFYRGGSSAWRSRHSRITSDAISKASDSFQRLASLRMPTSRLVELVLELGRQLNLASELRPRTKLSEPISKARMQPRDRIAAERQPGGVNEPGDVENADRLTEQVGLPCQPLFELVECLAKFQRRRSRRGISDALLGKPPPEIDLLR